MLVHTLPEVLLISLARVVYSTTRVCSAAGQVNVVTWSCVTGSKLCCLCSAAGQVNVVTWSCMTGSKLCVFVQLLAR